jgi:hypothetical protein
MPLIDLKTDLKSIKYGHDRPGGGDSGQPYIQTGPDTPSGLSTLVRSEFIIKDVLRQSEANFRGNISFFDDLSKFGAKVGDDGLIRGGAIGAINASITDTIRIGKFLTSTKGSLFIIKQAGLQLSNPRLEIKRDSLLKGAGRLLGNLLTNQEAAVSTLTGGLLQPTRIYNLGINTLTQVATSALGGHIVRHGLSPIQNVANSEATKYENIVRYNNSDASGYGSKNNRLVGLVSDLFQNQGQIKSLLRPRPFNNSTPNTNNTKKPATFNSLQTLGNTTIISPGKSTNKSIVDVGEDMFNYFGGPKSVYGIGYTGIKRYDSTENLSKKQDSKLATLLRETSWINQNLTHLDTVNSSGDEIATNSPASITANATGVSRLDSRISQYIKGGLNYSPDNASSIRDFTAISYTDAQPSLRKYSELIAAVDYDGKSKIYNREYDTINAKPFGNNGYSSEETGYDKIYRNSYDEVYTLPFNKWSDVARETRVGSGRYDEINLTPLFTAKIGSIPDKVELFGATISNINDLVKFRIGAVDSSNPNNVQTWMVFRAYLTALSDNIDASWNDVKYAGRGDKFYVYDGFTRKMSVSFKVAALSVDEMMVVYQKLNFLMGNLMPDYGTGIVMRGPLVRMTIGNYIDGQLCKLDSLSYTIPQDSPWEIGLGDKELILPHIMEVQLSFTPIGSQTQDENKIPEKSQTTSHIAQNYNGKKAGERNYIGEKVSQISATIEQNKRDKFNAAFAPPERIPYNPEIIKPDISYTPSSTVQPLNTPQFTPGLPFSPNLTRKQRREIRQLSKATKNPTNPGYKDQPYVFNNTGGEEVENIGTTISKGRF